MKIGSKVCKQRISCFNEMSKRDFPFWLVELFMGALTLPNNDSKDTECQYSFNCPVCLRLTKFRSDVFQKWISRCLYAQLIFVYTGYVQAGKSSALSPLLEPESLLCSECIVSRFDVFKFSVSHFP